MPNAVNDSTLRAQIHTDILAAWTSTYAPTRIVDNEPRLPYTASHLPYAVVLLTEVTQEPSGLRHEAQTYRYEITGVFAWPGSGTIAAAQETRANALLAQLTANRTYATIGRDFLAESVLFDQQGGSDEQEPVYTVTTVFVVTVYDEHSTA